MGARTLAAHEVCKLSGFFARMVAFKDPRAASFAHF